MSTLLLPSPALLHAPTLLLNLNEASSPFRALSSSADAIALSFPQGRKTQLPNCLVVRELSWNRIKDDDLHGIKLSAMVSRSWPTSECVLASKAQEHLVLPAV
ncbi:hypothetical protein EV1_034054 [Malus domestica]